MNSYKLIEKKSQIEEIITTLCKSQELKKYAQEFWQLLETNSNDNLIATYEMYFINKQVASLLKVNNKDKDKDKTRINEFELMLASQEKYLLNLKEEGTFLESHFNVIKLIIKTYISYEKKNVTFKKATKSLHANKFNSWAKPILNEIDTKIKIMNQKIAAKNKEIDETKKLINDLKLLADSITNLFYDWKRHQTLILRSLPKLIEPHLSKINWPISGDGSCFYWSTIFAFLMRGLDNEETFILQLSTLNNFYKENKNINMNDIKKNRILFLNYLKSPSKHHKIFATPFFRNLVQSLRNQIADHILKDPVIYANFFYYQITDEKETENPMPKYENRAQFQFNSSKNISHEEYMRLCLEEYAKRIRNKNEWAGGGEYMILTTILKTNIITINKNSYSANSAWDNIYISHSGSNLSGHYEVSGLNLKNLSDSALKEIYSINLDKNEVIKVPTIMLLT